MTKFECFLVFIIMILTILIVIFSLLALIIIHELGHFVIAKKFGVKVEEFGIGFPPRLFGKKIGETLYSLNLLPFGAFVKIHGEDYISSPEKIDEKRSFRGKPIWQRALIVLGGVLSFWLISVILFIFTFWLGTEQTISDEDNHSLINPKVRIIAVAKNSPAQMANLKPGDAVLEFTAEDQQFKINKVKELQELTEIYKGREIKLTIERGKEIFEVRLTPRASPPEGEGPMGVALARTVLKSYPLETALVQGIKFSFNLTKAIILGLTETLKSVLTGKELPAEVQVIGPVGIGSLMTQAFHLGTSYFLQFIALISLYLALFNILPIPAVDGGKLLFLGIEKIRGRALNQKIEHSLNAIFLILLVILMIWVTIQDIIRIF